MRKFSNREGRFGITGYSLKKLMRIAEDVPVDTILSYCRYNLMTTDMDLDLTPFAQDKHIGLINASGLHMGVLTERGGAGLASRARARERSGETSRRSLPGPWPRHFQRRRALLPRS